MCRIHLMCENQWWENGLSYAKKSSLTCFVCASSDVLMFLSRLFQIVSCVFVCLLFAAHTFKKMQNTSGNVSQFFSVQFGSLIKSFAHSNCCRNCAEAIRKTYCHQNGNQRSMQQKCITKRGWACMLFTSVSCFKQVILLLLYTFLTLTPCEPPHFSPALTHIT